jgi:acylphosphatase
MGESNTGEEPILMKKSVRLVLDGEVQGVCFRMYARETAQRLGVTGWIRNLQDGAVEAMAEGDEEALSRFVEWCRHGPPYAHVTRITEQYSNASESFSSFDITR